MNNININKSEVDPIKFQEDGFEVIGRYLHSFVVLKSTKKVI